MKNERTYRFGDSQLTIVLGDITTTSAEALVSSDDYYLTMGGGVSAAISSAGGSGIALDAGKAIPAAVGDVVVTTAGTLPARYVFHAVTIGPGASDLPPEDIITSATRRCLELADELRIRSLAFPAIGTGTASFSLGDAAVHMATVLAEHLTDRVEPMDVYLYLYDPSGQDPLRFVPFFEQFAARLPRIAEREAEPLAETTVRHRKPAPATAVQARGLKLRKRASELEGERERLEASLATQPAEHSSETEETLRQLDANQKARLTVQAQLNDLTSAGLEVFLSYAHEDEPMCNALVKHLSGMRREGLVTGWHDRKIVPGDDWAGQIDEHLRSAKIILLMISANFMASDYCNDIEVKLALQREQTGEAAVIPVILRPVDWGHAPFSSLQALPADARPVASWSDRDAAFLDIVEGIRRRAEVLAVSD